MLKLLSDGWMYIHIPRTSGANFKQIVSQYYKGEYNIFSKSFDDIDAPIVSILWENVYNKYVKTGEVSVYRFNLGKRNLLFEVQHAPLWAWQKVEMYNDEKIMTIVRNPYTKFISHYYASLYFLDRFFEFKSPSPTEFVKHENINRILEFAPANYLVKQVDYIKDINGNIKCDKIYKMETDLKILESDFKLKNIDKFKYNKADYIRDYKNLYTDELIQFVQERYKEDFEYFEYDKEPFW